MDTKKTETGMTGKNPPVKTRQAYEFIRAKILDGTYGPGYRLVIDTLAQELRLSSIPVREAIRWLEADNFVQVIPYSGAVVQLLNEQDFEETLLVLGILAGAATALATKFVSKRDLKNFNKINAAMMEAMRNLEFELFGELNREFHTAICEKCGNAYLIERNRLAWQRLSQIRRSGFSFAPQRAGESVEEHRRLLEMIENQAPDVTIEAFVRQHKAKMWQAVQERKAVAKSRSLL